MGRQTVRWLAAGLMVTVVGAGAGTASAGTGGPATTARAAAAASAPRWRIVKTVNGGASSDFTAVVASSQTTGWAFNGAGFAGTPAPVAYEHTGANWAAWTRYGGFPGKAGETVVAAAATSAADVWAVSEVSGTSTGGRVFHWDGRTWTVVATFGKPVGGLAVLGPGDVWVFGDQEAYPSSLNMGAYHYDGHAWAQVASGRGLAGGSALSGSDVWAFRGTDVARWTGSAWHLTSLASLLPKKVLLNDPHVTGIIAVSKTAVYAIGNGSAEDDGGPTVVLHYDGHAWARAASGSYGYGTVVDAPTQSVSSDGGRGLWLPQPGADGAPSHLVRFTGGALQPSALPVNGSLIAVGAVSRVPGTTGQIAGGYTHNAGYTSKAAVLLEYS